MKSFQITLTPATPPQILTIKSKPFPLCAIKWNLSNQSNMQYQTNVKNQAKKAIKENNIFFM
jgi:hypothetical protein